METTNATTYRKQVFNFIIGTLYLTLTFFFDETKNFLKICFDDLFVPDVVNHHYEL